MKTKLFPMFSLVVILGLTGCAGVKNSMRVSEKNSAWNPLHRLTGQKNDLESSTNPLQRLIEGKKSEQPAKPVTMTAIWKDTVYEGPGTPTVKGFGGRFYFYDKNNAPVKAEGELIVYGFDDSKKESTESVADKKFVFRSEEFQQHFSESAIGASYSVWIPWEKTGGFQKSITLIPMFRMADGAVLKSGQSTVNLPGKTPEQRNSETSKEMPYRVLGSSPTVVKQADFKASSNEQTASNGYVANATFESESQGESTPRIRTSTFRLTRNLSRRIAQASSPQHPSGRKTAQSNAEDKPTRLGTGDFESETAAGAKQDSTAQNNQQGNSDPKPSNPRRSAFGQPGSY